MSDVKLKRNRIQAAADKVSEVAHKVADAVDSAVHPVAGSEAEGPLDVGAVAQSNPFEESSFSAADLAKHPKFDKFKTGDK